MKKLLILLTALCFSFPGLTQIEPSQELMKFYTPQWEGPRDDHGRPMVSDDLLNRLLKLSIEEVWGVLRNEGYNNQFESGWIMLHDDQPFVGHLPVLDPGENGTYSPVHAGTA